MRGGLAGAEPGTAERNPRVGGEKEQAD